MVKSRPQKVDSRNRRPDTGNRHHSRMFGQHRCSDVLALRRKHDHERSDEGSPRVKATLGSNIATRNVERTERHYVDPRKIWTLSETYKENGTNTFQNRENWMTNSVSPHLIVNLLNVFFCCLDPSFCCGMELCVYFIHFNRAETRPT